MSAIRCYSSKLSEECMDVVEEERGSWSDIIKSACSKLADSADRLLIASVVGENAPAPHTNTQLTLTMNY